MLFFKYLKLRIIIFLRKKKLLSYKKIIYLSCHSVLEFDEINIFRDLGHYVFSPGDYVNEKQKGRPWLRPSQLESYDHVKHLKKFLSYGKKSYENKSNLSKEFIQDFDIVYVMHNPEWIIKNWEVIKHKTVIWRTIGQSNERIEKELLNYRRNGLKIIRYSPKEKNITNYLGHDAIIRFYKDPNEFNNWDPRINKIMNITQDFSLRSLHCNYELYEFVSKHLPCDLYGYGNNNINAELSFEELKKRLKAYRCYFYTGTYPASYTLSFIEAWMTGIPIVALGNKLKHSNLPNNNLYEIPDIITHGRNGFIADTKKELLAILKKLLSDKKLALKISKKARQDSIKIFGKKSIMFQWEQFYKNL